MTRFLIYAILSILIQLTLNANAPFAISAPRSSAEALRAHLQSEGVIFPRPEVPDILTTATIASTSIKQCSGLNVFDTPQNVSQNRLSLFRVNFDRDPSLICARSSKPNACRAISRNCIAYGRALFCDIAYLERFRRIAEATYFTRFRRLARSHDGITGDQYDTISPTVMKEIAEYELSLSRRKFQTVNPSTHPGSLGYIQHLYDCTAQKSGGRVGWFAAASTLLGHEISHLLEFACPAGERATGVARSLAESYEEVMCRDVSRAESLADVRSQRFIELPLKMAEGLDAGDFRMSSPKQTLTCNYEALKLLGISASGAAAAITKIKRSNVSLMMLTIANLVEYEIASFGPRDAALKAYTGGLKLSRRNATSREMNDYYVNHARNNIDMNSMRNLAHGLPALRGLGLLVGAGYPEFWRDIKKKEIPNSTLVRLSGLIAGQVAKANELGCGKTEKEAEVMGWQMVNILMSFEGN